MMSNRSIQTRKIPTRVLSWFLILVGVVFTCLPFLFVPDDARAEHRIHTLSREAFITRNWGGVDDEWPDRGRDEGNSRGNSNSRRKGKGKPNELKSFRRRTGTTKLQNSNSSFSPASPGDGGSIASPVQLQVKPETGTGRIHVRTASPFFDMKVDANVNMSMNTMNATKALNSGLGLQKPLVGAVLSPRENISFALNGNPTPVVVAGNSGTGATAETETSPLPPSEGGPRCALLFFGLPRSFELLVLPSIVKNVLIPNIKNRCDIFLHFYLVRSEKNSRSGSGGIVDPMEVFKLKDAVARVYDKQSPDFDVPLLSFTNDTDDEFYRKRGAQLEKYRKAKGPDGHFLYYPWMAKSYTYPTSIENIVKQWHSIQSVWDDMTQTANRLKRNYTRVAMLRNDAVYVTPFDVHKQGINTPVDTNNTDVMVPNWARFPVNDRMIYGPRDAIRIWATERFERLESHVLTYEPGYGMHSERFLNHSIFPAIIEQGYGVVPDLDLCFFRARADGSAWINDCATRNGAAKGFRSKINTQALVEAIVGKSCRKSKFNNRIIQLHCLPEENNKTGGASLF